MKLNPVEVQKIQRHLDGWPIFSWHVTVDIDGCACQSFCVHAPTKKHAFDRVTKALEACKTTYIKVWEPSRLCGAHYQAKDGA